MRLFRIFLFLLLIFGYLFFSYIRFYNFIGEVNLKSPFLTDKYSIGVTGKSPPIKYVAIGDSLTAGVGSLDMKDTFPYQYALKLEEKYKKVDLTILGYPGAMTQDVISNQLDQLIQINPDYITLEIGVNDIHNKISRSVFESNYKHILTELTNKTKAQIIVLNIPYLGSSKVIYPPFNYLLNYRTVQFNDIIYSLVESNECIKFIDLYKATTQFDKQYPDYYSTDLFHPSAKGYLLWGKIINAN